MSSDTGNTLEWPWQYSFPPFFTLQPHAETRAKQVGAWKDLILWYCQKMRLYVIDIGEVGKMPLFHNAAINRTLPADVAVSILTELERSEHAKHVDGLQRRRWHIFWHTPHEWATLIYDFINQKGMQNSVLTLYELSHGDDVKHTEWFGINTDVLIHILKVLEAQHKCELIVSDEEQGVKFF